jgi:hypothetical protein
MEDHRKRSTAAAVEQEHNPPEGICIVTRVAKAYEPGTLEHLRSEHRTRRPPETSFRTGDDVLPRSGDVIHVTKAASVQFTAPMLFRVIRVHDWPTYDGWIWLDGYELNSAGDAVERRSIFVQVSGLRQIGKAPDPRTRNARRPGAAPVTVPGRPVRTNR